MTIFTLVQPTLYSRARKLSLAGIVGVVHRNIVSVNRRCFGCIRFFLLNVVQPISFAEAFQLRAKGKNWDLNKVLIIAFTHIAILFQRWVVSHNNRPNLSTETEINYVPRSFIRYMLIIIAGLITFCTQTWTRIPLSLTLSGLTGVPCAKKDGFV